ERIGKDQERASPGYYAATLTDSKIRAEVTATEHAAIYRFRYDGGGRAKLLFDGQWGIVYKGKLANHVRSFSFELDGNTGFGSVRRTFCWTDRTAACKVEFSRPFADFEKLPKRHASEKGDRYVFGFDLKPGETLLVKVALSRKDVAAAARNLAAEIPGWDFERVRSRAKASWDSVLGLAEVEGSEDQKRNWYTALYHLCIQPNNVADAGEAPFYSTLSCWDTFRAAHPLYTILMPDKVSEMLSSMLKQGRITGFLPIWTLWGVDTVSMIGAHSIPVIVDAYLKGIPFDSAEAYRQIKDTLTQKHNRVKENWDIYDRYGYYPFDLVKGESVSRTLECAYDDWCAGEMAARLGRKEDAVRFRRRADYWKNVFDTATGMVRGKDSHGKWRTPFDPYAFGHGAGRDNDFTEGNAFQYTWHVMHDVDGLVSAMGGKEAALAKLESLFKERDTIGGAPPDVTGLIGQYVHGNEPSHHVIYLFTLLERPDLAAKYVREVFDRFYLPKPNGLCGNDDCGQMSAWYVFSAMGFYPFNPCGGEYVIGAPQIPQAKLKLANGKIFTVAARNLSKKNKYVKSVTLNGKPVTDWKIRHADIMCGGELVFEMTDVVPASGIARWIAAPGNESPAFEKVFTVPPDATSVSLTIAAPGFYEAYLNGKRIGDRVLDPSPTDFTKRVLTVSHRLPSVPGDYSLKVLLGHGWYCQRSIATWDNHRDSWRSEPCLKASIAIMHKDGRKTVIGTDASWRQAASPLAYDDLREGEILDPGFVLPRPGRKEFAVEVAGPKGRLVPMVHPPARIVRIAPPKSVKKVKDGWMFDFGENLAGWTRMEFSDGKRGDVVTIRYDERIRPDGEPTVHVEKKSVPHHREDPLWGPEARAIDCYFFQAGSTNILPGGVCQQDRFVIPGPGTSVYEPRFTYHGFRYVWVRGCEKAPDAVACEIRTDFAETGSFVCSDVDFSDLMAMADRSYKSNFTDGVPTDCPHREKNGWTGDAQFASEFAQYAYDNTEAYIKWLGDIVDHQDKKGMIGGVVPSGGWGRGEKGQGCVWDSAMAIIPWNIYVYKGDDRGIRLVFPALRKYLDYIRTTLDSNGLVAHGIGDWIPVDRYVDNRFCASAYRYGMLQIASKIARDFGMKDVQEEYAREAEAAKMAFNRAFHKGDGLYAEGLQTHQALPITFGLVDAAFAARTAQRLVDAVHASGDHMDFGVVGSKHVFRALAETGHADLAWKMLKQRTKPSFLVWRDAGSSTLWEDWETGFSRNHVMFGDFACWAYQYLAGIRLPAGGTLAVPDPAVKGMREIVFDPKPVPGLDRAQATVMTQSGLVTCGWKRTASGIEKKISAPEGVKVL
ncbi:MAG: GH92 family glycosyl hydrolase, partial [Kiritimatiellae bacterium]|nr:GH92 family glycosyl hydrolase [Kiritimatiellia bacterium]